MMWRMCHLIIVLWQATTMFYHFCEFNIKDVCCNLHIYFNSVCYEYCAMLSHRCQKDYNGYTSTSLHISLLTHLLFPLSFLLWKHFRNWNILQNTFLGSVSWSKVGGQTIEKKIRHGLDKWDEPQGLSLRTFCRLCAHRRIKSSSVKSVCKY